MPRVGSELVPFWMGGGGGALWSGALAVRAGAGAPQPAKKSRKRHDLRMAGQRYGLGGRADAGDERGAAGAVCEGGRGVRDGMLGGGEVLGSAAAGTTTGSAGAEAAAGGVGAEGTAEVALVVLGEVVGSASAAA